MTNKLPDPPDLLVEAATALLRERLKCLPGASVALSRLMPEFCRVSEELRPFDVEAVKRLRRELVNNAEVLLDASLGTSSHHPDLARAEQLARAALDPGCWLPRIFRQAEVLAQAATAWTTAMLDKERAAVFEARREVAKAVALVEFAVGRVRVP